MYVTGQHLGREIATPPPTMEELGHPYLRTPSLAQGGLTTININRVYNTNRHVRNKLVPLAPSFSIITTEIVILILHNILCM